MTYIGNQEAMRILGITSAGTLPGWAKADKIPWVQDGKQQVYPSAYIRRLAYLAAGRKPTSGHMQLCTLEWRKNNASTWSEGRQVLAATKTLQQQGELLTFNEVASLTGYSKWAVQDWADKYEFLPAARIGGIRLCLRTDVLRAKKILDGLTAHEAAERLGVAHRTLLDMARKKTIVGVEAPGGLRFDPAEVNRVRAVRQAQDEEKSDRWTAAQVKAELRISQETLMGWVNAGVLNSIKVRGQNFYDVEDVRRLKRQQQTLKGEFAWIKRSDVEQLYVPRMAARKLGKSSAILAIWAKEGLVPYYDLSPESMQRAAQRYYLAFYVDELVEYAKSLHSATVTKQMAARYKQLAAARAK